MSEKTEIWALFTLMLLLIGGAFFVITYGPTGLDTFQIGTATFNVRATAEISVIKTDNPDPVFSGATLSYSLLVNVTGNLSNVTVVDSYPPNVAFNGSQPPPNISNNTWLLGNLFNTTFQINITVNVSPTFTGILINNATAFGNLTNGTTLTANDTEPTTVISPAVPPAGGGGAGGAGGCIVGQMKIKAGGQLKDVFLCCSDDDCSSVWGLKGYSCGMQPPVLAAQCIQTKYLETPSPSGICPTQRTCGALCCPMGTMCVNSQCLQPQKTTAPLPEPPESYYMLNITEYGLLWLLFLLLLALIILFLIVLIAALGEHKKKKRRK